MAFSSYSEAREGRPGCVHGNVPASDDNHPFSNVDLESLIGVDEELDGPQHPVGFVALDVETATEVGADRQEHGVVLGPQVGQRHI